MYCPGCGNEQVNDGVKFCVKCGLSLDGIKQLTSGRGMSTTGRRLSRRAKGILQGVAIVPVAFGLWLLLDIFYEVVFGAGMLGGLYAMFTLIALAAIVRIVYAVFYEGGLRPESASFSPERLKELSTVASDRGELPVANTSDILGVDVLPLAGEVAPPHSVTEHTTTKLDRK